MDALDLQSNQSQKSQPDQRDWDEPRELFIRCLCNTQAYLCISPNDTDGWWRRHAAHEYGVAVKFASAILMIQLRD